MSFTRADPALERPIEGIESLLDYFRAAEKPASQQRVGTEHEKIGLYAADLSPVPYEGPRGIRALLEALGRDGGWAPLGEDGQLLGLERGQSSVTLEPGGQLELAGAPYASLFDTAREIQEHLAQLREVSEPLGIAWLGLGAQPLLRGAQLPRMPRERHALMRAYLGARGSLALDMMHGTAGVQASFDFTSEADAAQKLRVALAASPLVSALYANSCIAEGRPSGYESWRTRIWRDTDPGRCGLLPFVFEERCAEWGLYRSYAEWALDVPLFFTVRGGHHRPAGGRTLRQLLQAPLPGEPVPTLGDWHVHLTTLFPEVRLKRVIEVRGADAVPAGLVCALPALWKGLLYDPMSLHGAYKRLVHWTHADVDRLHLAAAREGLSALTPDGPALAVVRELVELSAQGLARLAAHWGTADERPLLEPIAELLARGCSLGREALERWNDPRGGGVAELVRAARY